MKLSVPFRIVHCWTEHDNHQTSFIKAGTPARDSRNAPLCHLYDEYPEANRDFDNHDFHNHDLDFQKENYAWNRKLWRIRLRLAWDALPDSRQKALQQLLRTKPQLQWEAVPDLQFDSEDLQSPITISPIMIRCYAEMVSIGRGDRALGTLKVGRSRAAVNAASRKKRLKTVLL